MLLAFAEKNPGMVRVMIGDALVGEHERLQARMNQFFDRFEATLKQALRAASDGDAAGRAATLLRYSIGCLHQYAKSGFARKPTENARSAQRRYLLGIAADQHYKRSGSPAVRNVDLTHLSPQTLHERLTRTGRHSAALASNITRRPLNVSPIPARSLMASAACMAPMTPVSGANTPMTEHCTSSISPSSGKRQA